MQLKQVRQVHVGLVSSIGIFGICTVNWLLSEDANWITWVLN